MQTRLSHHHLLLIDTFFLWKSTPKCRQMRGQCCCFVLIIAEQISSCLNDWSESSRFTLQMMCEKKIKTELDWERNRCIINWVDRSALCSGVREASVCTHNRIAIIIGSLDWWALLFCHLYPLSIIVFFCSSRLQWIEKEGKVAKLTRFWWDHQTARMHTGR